MLGCHCEQAQTIETGKRGSGNYKYLQREISGNAGCGEGLEKERLRWAEQGAILSREGGEMVQLKSRSSARHAISFAEPPVNQQHSPPRLRTGQALRQTQCA
jgi:hypothetical protein